MLLVVFVRSKVSILHHHLDVRLVPVVQLQRLDATDVNAHLAVDAGGV